MEMIIDDELKYEKRMIGLLVFYYRKKLDINLDEFLYNTGKYYSDNCIACNLCSNSVMICTPKTLYRIEKGCISKNECYYHRLAEKLDKEFIVDRKIYNRLHQYESCLIDYLVNFSKKKLSKLESLIDTDLLKYSNMIYISEKLNLLKDIINFKLYRLSPDKDKIELYLYMKDHFEDPDRKLLLLFLYDIRFRLKTFNIDYETIINECNDHNDDPLFYRIKLANIAQMNYLDAYPRLKNEETNNIENLNNYQKYSLYEYLAFVELNANSYEKSYISMQKCIDILDESQDFSDYHKISCYKQMGKISFLLEKYEDVIKWYSIILDQNESIGLNYSLLFYSLEKTNQEELIRNILDNVNLSKTKTISEKKILLYYKKKYMFKKQTKQQIIELEEYICEEIKPLLKNLGSMHKSIFSDEIKKLVSITGDYKKIYLFEL